MKDNADSSKKNNVLYFVPLYIAAAIAVLCFAIVFSVLYSKGAGDPLPFLNADGTFKYNDPQVPLMSFSMMVMMLGLLVAVIVSIARCGRYKLTPVKAAIATVLFFLASYLGAKLLYGVERLLDHRNWSMNGQSLFGVLYMAIPAVPLIAFIFRKKVNDMSDFLVTTYLILLSFIRVTCFVTGCCFAREMYFDGVPVMLPVQLFEIIIDLAILSFCFWMDRPQGTAERGKGIAPLLMITYCASRFFLEFIRANPKFFLGMTVSQCHCVIFFVFGTVWYWRLRCKKS